MADQSKKPAPLNKGCHYQLSRRPRSSQTFSSTAFADAFTPIASEAFTAAEDVGLLVSPTWKSSVFCAPPDDSVLPDAVLPTARSGVSISTGLAPPEDLLSSHLLRTGKKMVERRQADETSSLLAGESGERESAKKHYIQSQQKSLQVDTLLRSQFDLSSFPSGQESEHKPSRKLVIPPQSRHREGCFSGKKIVERPQSMRSEHLVIGTALESRKLNSAVSCDEATTGISKVVDSSAEAAESYN